MTNDASSPPGAWLRLLESRAVFELGASAASFPLLRLVGRGDQHPVLVLPGFMASDRSTAPLRNVLRSQGYWTHGWQLGRNLGPTSHIVDGMLERLSAIYERHQRPVSIVGWSLGGIYGRRLAIRAPEMVRQVITLGSPFRLEEGDQSSVSRLFDRLKPLHAVNLGSELPNAVELPAGVPATAIYTRTDGVVRWFQCIEKVGPMRENIEVRGSHSGLGFNPAVLLAVSDRLAQREHDWRPFHAPTLLRHMFPRSVDFDGDRKAS
ncbi:MAG TPA: alpha/beta hydrolase [Ilumatobacter sp.]|nr:alpha/beta hydrolase [Ilumatobacter sp.]